ncbi:MAG: excinuclease ABC subunit UvrC [Desulfobulbus sp.]|jgi:excinuclease ABC subunit C
MATPTSNPESEHEAAAEGPLSAAFLATVSHGPGVYQMLGKRQVLYVGKARDLRKRLAQYAHYSGPAHSKTAAMLSHVRRVETILTTTEKEALILEAALIKQHRPRYNVILRDDKNYPLIKVTIRDPWPRIVVTRRRLRDGNRYFGPYAAPSAMRATLNLLHSHFPLRRCPTVRTRTRPCLNAQMGRCLAPCVGAVDQETYRQLVDEVLLVLEGRIDKLVKKLTAKMEQAAANLAFEQAAHYRDQIQALEQTTEHQVIAADEELDQDVFGIHRRDAGVGIALLCVRGGVLTGALSFFLADPLGEDDALLAQTLLQYYSAERQPPRAILLPLNIEEQELVGERLSELREGPVSLSVPQRGKRMQLMRMAAANAEQLFSEEARRQASWAALSGALQSKLLLSRVPEVIECLDISNLQGRQAVGALVCFVRGEKAGELYRHYRIRTLETPDDYAMMGEVLERRLQKGVEEDNLPDLLLLDGGKGQLQVAVNMLARFDLQGRVDLAALAEERAGEGEKLFRPGRKNPIPLPSHSPVLLYLMRIRDEAHRFGITFHRRLRGKDRLRSALDDLVGVGPKRRQALLRALGSVKRVRQASIDELAQVPGIGPELARSIHSQLHQDEESSANPEPGQGR